MANVSLDASVEKLISAFAQKTETPFFLFHESVLRSQMQNLQDAFSWNEGASFYVPVAQNPNPSVLRILCNTGCGVLCQSTAELLLAEDCGFCGNQVLYAAFTLHPEAERIARRLGATFLIDGLHTMPDTPVSSALLCMTPGAPVRYSGKTFSVGSHIKLGMREDALMEAAEKLYKQGTEIGLFLYGSECAPDVLYPAVMLDAMMQQAERLRDFLQIPVNRLCLFGSPTVSYRASVPAAELSDVSNQVRLLMQKRKPKTMPSISFCAGRYILADAGELFTRVLAIKKRMPDLVICDFAGTQMLHLLQAGGYHDAAVLCCKEAPSRIYELTGCLFDNRDYLQGHRFLPELVPGDILYFRMSGAMGYGYGSSYGGYGQIPAYLMDCNGVLIPVSEHCER